MVSRISQIFSTFWFRWLLIPLFLFVTGVFVAIATDPSTGFFVLTENHYENELTSWKTSELRANQKIKGEFVAKKENLGIVAVRFNTFNRINKDEVIFRIKEKGQKDWFYENTYKVDQFQPNEFFTFGFPLQTSSEGKSYQFEIVSTKGKRGDAVAISYDSPVIYLTKYQFSGRELLDNKSEFGNFLITKVNDIFLYTNYSNNLQPLFFLPLIIYAFWLLLRIPFIVHFAVLGFFILLFIDIFIVKESYLRIHELGIFIFLVSAFIILTLKYKLESTGIFWLGIFFFILSPFLVVFGDLETAERAGKWGFVLFGLGTIFGIGETIINSSKRVNLQIFLERSLGFILLKREEKIIYKFEQKLLYIAEVLFGKRPTTYKEYFFTSLRICLALIIVTSVVVFADTKHQEVKRQEATLSHTPTVLNVEPRIVYYANKVIIEGHGFGSLETGKVKLYKNNNEEIKTILWTDSKIIFEIPLHWRIGDFSMRIQREVNLYGENKTFISQPIPMKLIDRTGPWSEEDDDYYEQLKYMKRETLELNGY